LDPNVKLAGEKLRGLLAPALSQGIFDAADPNFSYGLGMRGYWQ